MMSLQIEEGNDAHGKQYQQQKQHKIQCFLMRHAQSKFNQIMHTCQYDSLSQQAKTLYQLDPQLIDCPLTTKGLSQIQHIQFPNEPHSPPSFDLIFVSPLNRTLQTAKLMIQCHKIRCKRVIVLPGLTEVVSKVCDFGGCVLEKLGKYRYEWGGGWGGSEGGSVGYWQDALIQDKYLQQVDYTKPNGQRYMNILSQIFPQPLQSAQRCQTRSFQVMQQIKNISHMHKASKILVITHNRILKNILTKGLPQNLEGFKIMGNCEIRTIQI